MSDKQQILARIDELLGIQLTSDDLAIASSIVSERLHGTRTLLSITHGAESPQAKAVQGFIDRVKSPTSGFALYRQVGPALEGTLRSLRAEVEAGLVTTVALQSAGEVVADILGLAKEALANKNDGAKNVAAVLVAAAFEDAIRRMGATLGNVKGRPDLADVLTALKQKQVLAGPSVTTAQGYLKFRNDALHADWEKIDRAVIGSCLAFTEGLLTTHFV